MLDTSEKAADGVWRIGRAVVSDIAFRVPYVSLHHARLRFDEESGAWQILDEDSTNGTWLNDLRLKTRTWHNLSDYDTVAFGTKSATFTVSYNTDDTLLRERTQPEPDTQMISREEQKKITEADNSVKSWPEAIFRLLYGASPVQLFFYTILGISISFLLYLFIKH